MVKRAGGVPDLGRLDLARALLSVPATDPMNSNRLLMKFGAASRGTLSLVLMTCAIACGSSPHSPDSGQACSDSTTCVAPPPPQCVSDTTVRQYSATGSCTDGSCSYDYTDTECAGQCDSGVCVCASASWVITTVDSSPAVLGMTPSLALDASGGAHIASRNETGKDLRYASRPRGGAWTTSFIAMTGDVGYVPALAIDATGIEHVAYGSYDATHGAGLLYARRDPGGTWKFETIWGSGLYDHPALVVDAGGTVRVAFWSNAVNHFLELYARPPLGSWVKTADLYSVGNSPVIAPDPSGGMHLLYQYYTAPDYQVVYQYLPPASTVFESAIVVEPDSQIGFSPALELAPSGELHASYYDKTNGDLRYAHRPVGGSWVATAIDTQGDVGLFTAMALDAAGGIYISYMATNGDVKLAYKSPGGSWMISMVDSVGPIGTGQGGGTSIALDGSGGVVIAYFDFAHGDLKVAERQCQ